MASIIKTIPQPLGDKTSTKIKISALLCCLTGSVLLIVSIISRHWLVADGYQQGLWEECFWGDQFDIICRSHSTETTWILSCAALCTFAVLLSLGGTTVLLIHLANGCCEKTCLGKTVIVLLFSAALFLLSSLIIFTTVFVVQEMALRSKAVWYFEWAYGTAWSSLLFISVSLLLCVCSRLHITQPLHARTIVTNGQQLHIKQHEMLFRF